MIDNEEFAELVAENIMATDAHSKVRFDRVNFSLNIDTVEPSRTSVINLGHYYHEYSQAPSRLDDIISSIVLGRPSSDTVPDSYEAAKSRLYIHVQDRWTVESQRLLFELRLPPFADIPPGHHVGFPYVEFGESFALVVAYDTPTSRHIVNSTNLSAWKVDFGEIVNFAAAQLAARSNSEFERIAEVDSLDASLKHLNKDSKIYKSTWDDSYDAARVWTPQLYSGLKVMGRMMAMIPSAPLLLITGMDDVLGLAFAYNAYVMEREEGTKSLPPFPLVFENSVPVKYVFAENHPFYMEFKREQDLYWSMTYQKQSDLLKQTRQAMGGQLNIAHHYNFTTEEEHGSLSFSVCTVLEGMSNTIPRTDYIQFARLAANGNYVIYGNGQWEKVMEACGKSFRPFYDYYPPRFQIDKFPTEVELEQCKTEEWQLDVF